jgi:uncharacterized membrane protein YozB (DUF420 family)
MDLRDLPTLNTFLNATTTVLLLLGRAAIARRDEARHKQLMLAAAATSVAFLVSYLVYHYNVGSVRYQGEGAIRVLYFAILISHTLLAVVNAPLVAMTIYYGLRDVRERHRKLARFTYPIWLYVSVTGIVVYLMLYVLPQ